MAAIVSGDISWRYTTTAGAAGDTTAKGANGTYLGKYITTSTWAGGDTNGVFDDISGADNAASVVDYAGLGIVNGNASNAAQNSVAYLSSEQALGADIAIWPDSTAASAKGGAGAQLLTIANKNTAPAASSFSSPTTIGTGLSMGTINSNFTKGLWVRRSAANRAALSNDNVTLAFTCDTGSL